jgi:nitroreductase
LNRSSDFPEEKVVDVFEAVGTRVSCRAFLDRPVETAVLRDLLERASRAPSGGNLQPWKAYVVTGEALSALKREIAAAISEHDPRHQAGEYPFSPADLGDPYKSRREEHGVQLYGALGIERSDVVGRLKQYKRNFDFFGAPAGIFLTTERQFGSSQWADLGAFLGTLLYLARGYGLDTCPQQSWGRVHQPLYAFLGVPPEEILYCGISVGYGDRSHPANRFRSTRAPLEGFATFISEIPAAAPCVAVSACVANAKSPQKV